MTNLDELEDLLRKGEKEKAYKLIKEDNGITTDILINGGIIFGTIEEDGLSISYFEFAEKISEDNEIKEEARGNLAVSYYYRGTTHSKLNKHEEAIENFNRAIKLSPNLAPPYVNRGITRLQTNKDLDIAIGDFKHARDLFEGKDKERVLGFIEWAKARKEMNMKSWDDFRERMNEAREIFEKISDPLSLSLDAFIKFSSLDEELDNALNISDPMETLKEIEDAQEMEEIKWAAYKKQKALEILNKYWSRLSSAIKVMNGISTRETENITLGREIKSELRVGFTETKEIISKGFEKSSEEHKKILEKIYETENILMQRDVINARYRIEFPPPPSPAKIIVDIPIGKLTEKQIEEKAKEVADKIKNLRGKVKKEFLEAIKRIPKKGDKLLKRLKKTKG